MTNRLAGETSPYLLQHAHNPVDWYPWGDEALQRARELDRPIFLSIGYSACHWCHVMERESFDDPTLASVLNADFVCVKVDREERPDLDGIYMRAVQALTGRGGWPLSAFLTPEGVPFHGGTYFPPEPRQGMPSFRQVLGAVADAWTNRRGQVEENAEQLRAALQSVDGGGSGAESGAGSSEVGGAGYEEPGMAMARQAYLTLRGQFDTLHGGFGGAPKFPQPVSLEFLLALHASTHDPAPLDLVVQTLRHMARGGIRDHLGGGFHRYAVDARWLVPHFEKMLYDNALLARVHVEAWRATGLDELREVAESTLDYLLDDLADPRGGFYAARDADSEGEEGLFYLWTPAQVAAVAQDAGIEEAEVRLFTRLYDVQPGGNFEGRSILHLPHGVQAVARSEGIEPEALRQRLAPLKAALLRARALREAPFRDEKVLCVWNAFAVRALAEAGVAFGREDYLQAATAAGTFLLEALRPEQRLLRVWIDGHAHVDAFLEDHAALGNAMLTLHEATLDPRWLVEAERLADEVVARFWSDDAGVLHDTAADAEPLVVRPREILDTATPSGNSLAVELLARAGHLFGRDDWTEVARRVLAREAEAAGRYPTAFGRLLTQVVRMASPPVEIAILGPADDERTRALLAAAWEGVHPNRSIVGGAGAGGDGGAGDGGGDGGALGGGGGVGAGTSGRSPLLEGRGTIGGAPTAYVCRAYTCEAPVTEAEGVRAALGISEP